VRPIGTKWVLKNKKDERGIVVRNMARLVVQGHTQEEGIDYDEVFAPVARIKAIRLFLAYASFMGFTVYQMDVKCAFLYGTIDEVVYVMQPPGFQDPAYLAKVYKVEKAIEVTRDKKNKVKDELPKEPNDRKPSEKVVIHDGHPDQTVTIGGNLTTECRTDIIEILRKHADAFAWTLTDMTGILRFIAEHELKIYPHIEPRVQRKRSIAPNRRMVVKEEVAE
nr:copia protein [Tanacetum cinerariifolium]